MANTTGKKFGGRKKGTPNKDTDLKIFIKNLVDDNQDKILEEIGKLKGKAYLDSVFVLLEYIQPKLSRTESDIKHTVDTPITIIKSYKDPNE